MITVTKRHLSSRGSGNGSCYARINKTTTTTIMITKSSKTTKIQVYLQNEYLDALEAFKVSNGLSNYSQAINKAVGLFLGIVPIIDNVSTATIDSSTTNTTTLATTATTDDLQEQIDKLTEYYFKLETEISKLKGNHDKPFVNAFPARLPATTNDYTTTQLPATTTTTYTDSGQIPTHIESNSHSHEPLPNGDVNEEHLDVISGIPPSDGVNSEPLANSLESFPNQGISISSDGTIEDVLVYPPITEDSHGGDGEIERELEQPDPTPIIETPVTNKTADVGVKTNGKLNPKQITEIVELYKTTAHTSDTLAELYGVNGSTITRNLKKHLTDGEYKNLIHQKRLNR